MGASLPSGSLIRVYRFAEDDLEHARRYAHPSERGTLYLVCNIHGLHELKAGSAPGECIDDVAALLNVKTSPNGWSVAGFVNPGSYGMTHEHFVRVEVSPNQT